VLVGSDGGMNGLQDEKLVKRRAPYAPFVCIANRRMNFEQYTYEYEV
jgi:hypothetical protein